MAYHLQPTHVKCQDPGRQQGDYKGWIRWIYGMLGFLRPLYLIAWISA